MEAVMEETQEQQTAVAQQQQQQLARITTCDRHPDVPVIGLCALCLRERLVDLEATRRTPTTAKADASSATAVLKSIFFRPSSSDHHQQPLPPPPPPRSSSSFLPQLRRCKSFSGGRRDGFYGNGTPRASSFEPQRKSCDVRGRNTLWALFNQDDHRQGRLSSSCNLENECRNLGFLPPVAPAPLREEEEHKEEEREEDEDFQDAVCRQTQQDELEAEDRRRAIEDEDMITEEVDEKTTRPIKEHIDLEQQQQQPKKAPPKDLKEIAGSFWLAASVFSKKLHQWRRKQKLKKQEKQQQRRLVSSHKPPRRSLDIQSEMCDDVFGRRSCDMAPRFSLDAGRMSLDDPRGSWDEPRASWDGYLIGGRSVLSRQPPMLSVMEDNPVPAVPRSDGLIPVEEDLAVPGGTYQTRDYYGDFPQRRRRSLDRSNSMHKWTAPATVAEHEELRVQPSNGNGSGNMVNDKGNARVSFELGSNESFQYSSTSLQDEWSESFDSGYRDPPKEVPHLPKKSRRRWSKAWNIWGFIRRSNDRGRNGVGRSLSESWPELRADNVYNNNRRMLRSNSSVSARSWRGNSGYTGGGYGSMRGNNGFHLDMNGGQWHTKKRRDEFALERNRSARYSLADNTDSNGMLRFYLPPMRNGRRGGMRSVKDGFRNSNSFTRSVMQLY